MEIQGRTVIVTGAARGIGRGIAEAFAREGARVVVADLGTLEGGKVGNWAYRLASEDELREDFKFLNINNLFEFFHKNYATDTEFHTMWMLVGELK